MKAKEIVFHLRNLKAGGTQSQNESISDMEYLAMVDYYRAILIRQQQGNNYRVNDKIVQHLGEIEVDLTYDEQTSLTVSEIPSPVETNIGVLIIEVKDTYGRKYQRCSSNSISWTHYSRFTKDQPKWFFLDNKIGVVNHAAGDTLKIAGIFESPLEAIKFVGKDNPLDPLDFEYPISITMLDAIYKMIMDSEMRFLMGNHNDTLNNSANENQG
jgi:hypothetical protein